MPPANTPNRRESEKRPKRQSSGTPSGTPKTATLWVPGTPQGAHQEKRLARQLSTLKSSNKKERDKNPPAANEKKLSENSAQYLKKYRADLDQKKKDVLGAHLGLLKKNLRRSKTGEEMPKVETPKAQEASTVDKVEKDFETVENVVGKPELSLKTATSEQEQGGQEKWGENLKAAAASSFAQSSSAQSSSAQGPLSATAPMSLMIPSSKSSRPTDSADAIMHLQEKYEKANKKAKERAHFIVETEKETKALFEQQKAEHRRILEMEEMEHRRILEEKEKSRNEQLLK
jgi:hypothetical protein